jgi:hypothetical protein
MVTPAGETLRNDPLRHADTAMVRGILDADGLVRHKLYPHSFQSPGDIQMGLAGSTGWRVPLGTRTTFAFEDQHLGEPLVDTAIAGTHGLDHYATKVSAFRRNCGQSGQGLSNYHF